jgi:hypothetical protein
MGAVGRFLFGRLHNRESVELSSAQRLDDTGVRAVTCCPEPHEAAVFVVSDRPGERR